MCQAFSIMPRISWALSNCWLLLLLPKFVQVTEPELDPFHSDKPSYTIFKWSNCFTPSHGFNHGILQNVKLHKLSKKFRYFLWNTLFSKDRFSPLLGQKWKKKYIQFFSLYDAEYF